MREQFEQKYKEIHPEDGSTAKSNGNYSGRVKQAHWWAWQARQTEIDQLKVKNTQLTHALVNASAEKSKWQKDYWSQVERSAEYGAMLMTDPDSLEFKCFQKEKQIEELTKQLKNLTSQLTLCREENNGLVRRINDINLTR